MAKRTTIISMLGVTIDRGKGAQRWERWRPTIALCSHEDLIVDRLELLFQSAYASMAEDIAADIRSVSPETEVRFHVVEVDDPWDFEQVYAALHDFAAAYAFAPHQDEYLVHMTTGTHVAQICLFLLTEARFIPARLIQTSPPGRRDAGGPGRHAIIDLDLSRYDRIRSRFAEQERADLSFLKAGIETKNAAFNALIERLEQVAVASDAPILLTGPTGVGKSQLARRIYQLKKSRHQVEGALVEVNCATLRGDSAMSTLFGHVKGAFTGAVSSRAGLLRRADGGMLFLDEIAELGPDEQAMLLRALEDRVFLPVGADQEQTSDFQLIAGTNRNLTRRARTGAFRDDLLARINLWAFEMPPLRDRVEDVEPNLEFELRRLTEATGTNITINKEARERFLDFATGEAAWPGNFRDFNAALIRMSTLATGGRITLDEVTDEINRQKAAIAVPGDSSADDLLLQYLPSEQLQRIDPFDRPQLAGVIDACRKSRSLSAAGRSLFAVSRANKKSRNDADRLRKYLARFGLSWSDLAG